MADSTQGWEIFLDGLDRVSDAALFLKLSRSKIYDLMEKRLLPFVKIGKSRRIPHRAVIELAAKNFSAYADTGPRLRQLRVRG